MTKRTIIVGDIHGCYHELNDLFDLIQLAADDRVIAVGDLIVKGTDSAAVLNRFIEDKRFSSVIGNHDLGVLNHWRGHGKVKKQQAACAEKLSRDKTKFESYLAAFRSLSNSKITLSFTRVFVPEWNLKINRFKIARN